MPHVCAPRRYLNSSHASFEEVCKAFLAEITPMTQGELPATCCLACVRASARPLRHPG